MCVHVYACADEVVCRYACVHVCVRASALCVCVCADEGVLDKGVG